MKRLSFLIAASAFCLPLCAWDGTTQDGHDIEVESYDHQGRGEGEVEYYDHEEGEYKSGYLDMSPGGSGTITDDETVEEIDVDME